MRIKIEINTHERSTACGLIRLPYTVESPWWSGRAQVLTFAPEELVATKLRALHQRRKGRDLFDLWLALTQMSLDPDEILRCFEPYRPDGYTRDDALASFDEKVRHTGFRNDLTALVTDYPDGYSVDAAAALVRAALLQRV
jgi:predicted nucleotidyltransferase component of viral defense system